MCPDTYAAQCGRMVWSRRGAGQAGVKALLLRFDQHKSRVGTGQARAGAGAVGSGREKAQGAQAPRKGERGLCCLWQLLTTAYVAMGPK